MNNRKSIKVRESTFLKLQAIKGSTMEEKIHALLIVYQNRELSETAYTRLMNTHMVKIEDVLKSRGFEQQKMFESLSELSAVMTRLLGNYETNNPNPND